MSRNVRKALDIDERLGYNVLNNLTEGGVRWALRHGVQKILGLWFGLVIRGLGK